MPTVRIDARDSHASAIVEVRERVRLLDVCDEVRASVPFSCRSATCGLCVVEVLEGAELLEDPETAERAVFADLCAAAHDRLACQTIVRDRMGLVRIRARRTVEGA